MLIGSQNQEGTRNHDSESIAQSGTQSELSTKSPNAPSTTPSV